MPGQPLDQFAVVLSYLLIIIALWISATRTLTLMVRLYQTQALILTSVVLITAFEPHRTLLALALIAVLPLALGGLVPLALARATLDDADARPDEHEAGSGPLGRFTTAQPRAQLLWLQHGGSRLPLSLSAAIDMFLIATAVLVAYRLSGSHSSVSVASSLAVSIALLLQGLFTMINKNDIVSQIIGLLVVDHGLFLAAVRVAPPALASWFVGSLFLYMLVTVIILVWVLPGLHRTSSSIEVEKQVELRG